MWPLIGKLLSSTLLWKCFFFKFYSVCNFGRFINFGLAFIIGTQRSERIENKIKATDFRESNLKQEEKKQTKNGE